MTQSKLTLAGMALDNGVLIIGPNHCAVSYYDETDELQTVTWEFKREAALTLQKIPLLRGLGALGVMFATLPQLKAHAPQAKLAFENPMFLGVGLISPMILSHWTKKWGANSAKTIIVSGTVPLLFSLAATRMSTLGKFHGAEHKAIGAYESGNTAFDTPKEHPRCGTQLAIPIMIASTLAQLALKNTMPAPMARISGQVLGMMVGIEVARAARNAEDSPLSQAITKTGLTLQSLFTVREPDQMQLVCGVAATNAVLKAEGIKKKVRANVS